MEQLWLKAGYLFIVSIVVGVRERRGGEEMTRKEIIQVAGIWNYIKWVVFNKVLRKKACISIEVFKAGKSWFRRYIDQDGNRKLTMLEGQK